MSIRESDRTDQSRVIDLIPIERKKNARGPFKTGSFANVSRVDITRGITETSREYIAERTQEQLRDVAASAANTDISSIRDTMLHLESIMEKNTAAKLALVTNAIDAKEALEDRLGSIQIPTGGAGLDTFGVLMLYPTKSGGPTWFSTSWTENPRNLTEGGGNDPQDARVSYSNGDPDTTPFQILGNTEGEALIDEFNSSCRLRVADTWINTEMTIYQFIFDDDHSFHDIQPRSRSRHETSCSFGNYEVKFRDTTDDTNNPSQQIPTEIEVSVEVEAMHPHYVRNLDEKVWDGIPRGQWVGFKMITRTKTSSGHVLVEGYVNYDITKQTANDWIKITEYLFDGNQPIVPSAWATDSSIESCIGLGDGQADLMKSLDSNCFRYLDSGNISWWRINGMEHCKWKYASVREIDPLP